MQSFKVLYAYSWVVSKTDSCQHTIHIFHICVTQFMTANKVQGTLRFDNFKFYTNIFHHLARMLNISADFVFRHSISSIPTNLCKLSHSPLLQYTLYVSLKQLHCTDFVHWLCAVMFAPHWNYREFSRRMHCYLWFIPVCSYVQFPTVL